MGEYGWRGRQNVGEILTYTSDSKMGGGGLGEGNWACETQEQKYFNIILSYDAINKWVA